VKIPLAVLIVEDSESDAQLILRLLRKADYDVLSERVETADEMRSALRRQLWDIIISDYSLPQFDGRAALELVQAECSDLPFIVVSGTIGEENAVALMKAGAHDLRASEEKYRMLIEQASDAIFLVSPDGDLLDVNTAGCILSGYTREEILSARLQDAMTNLLGIPLRFDELEVGKVLLSEREVIRKDGVKIWVEISATRLTDGNFQGIARDITQRKQAEQKLRQLSSAVEHGPASIVISDVKGRIEYVNTKFTEVNGFTLDEVLGKTAADTFGSNELQEEAGAEHWQAIRKGQEWRGEMKHRRKSGETYYASVSISPITDSSGAVTHFVAVSEDITARKAIEEKIRRLNDGLRQLAITDYLTNLYNRRYFMQRGAEEFKRAMRNKQPLSLLMLDVDHFKNVNDTYGHEAGDMALQQVAAVLKFSLRETDILGRIGGEEFAVLLPDTKLDAAAMLAERICRSVESSLLTMPGQALTISLTVSVGVAELSGVMSGIDDMLRHADSALYHAKHDGRNRVKAYSGEDDVSDLSPNRDAGE